MTFVEFCRAHGLLMDSLPPAGQWVRVATEDHKHKKNGAAKFLGDVGFVQNHATMSDVAIWRPESHEVARIDVDRIRREAEAYQAKVRAGWARAAARAGEMVRDAVPGEHDYLHYQGLSDSLGLVNADGTLLVPMRHWRTNELVGAQVIGWDPVERRWNKKMIPGTRAKGAVLRLGSRQAPRSWLVEGYATGLSVEAAARLLRLRDAVVVCFSAGNLVHVSGLLGGNQIVFADNDESGAGEAAAIKAGRPYVMSECVGDDANDVHKRRGLFALAQLMMGKRTAKESMA